MSVQLYVNVEEFPKEWAVRTVQREYYSCTVECDYCGSCIHLEPVLEVEVFPNRWYESYSLDGLCIDNRRVNMEVREECLRLGVPFSLI